MHSGCWEFYGWVVGFGVVSGDFDTFGGEKINAAISSSMSCMSSSVFCDYVSYVNDDSEGQGL
jgi:hypothetical protein